MPYDRCVNTILGIVAYQGRTSRVCIIKGKSLGILGQQIFAHIIANRQ